LYLYTEKDRRYKVCPCSLQNFLFFFFFFFFFLRSEYLINTGKQKLTCMKKACGIALIIISIYKIVGCTRHFFLLYWLLCVFALQVYTERVWSTWTCLLLMKTALLVRCLPGHFKPLVPLIMFQMFSNYIMFQMFFNYIMFQMFSITVCFKCFQLQCVSNVLDSHF
jgi:hypothetical protein